MGFGDIANSGTMPISGGGSGASNGDTTFSANAKFGGLNYNKGLNPWLVGGLVAMSLIAFVMLKK